MHTLRGRRRLWAVLALPFLLLLAGCGKLDASLDIHSVDDIDVVYDLAIQRSFIDEYGLGIDSGEAMCASYEDEDSQETWMADAKKEPWQDDTYVGCKLTGKTSADGYGEDAALTDENGEFHLVIPGSAAGMGEGDSSGMMEGFQLHLTISFPGKVISSNIGEVDGKTVTITDVDEFMQKGIDITAKDSSMGWIVWVIIAVVAVIVVLIVIALIVGLILMSRRKKKAGAAAAVPGGYGPGQMNQGAPGAPGAPAGYGSPNPAGQQGYGAPQGGQPGMGQPGSGQAYGGQQTPGGQGGYGSAPSASPAPQGGYGAPYGSPNPPSSAPQGDGGQGQSWSQPPAGGAGQEGSGQQGQPWSQNGTDAAGGGQTGGTGGQGGGSHPAGPADQPWSRPPQE